MEASSLREAIAAGLRAHPQQVITFSTKKERTARTFDEVRIELDQCVAKAKALGLSEGASVGVVAENSYEAVLLDLVLVTLGCTVVHIPESSAEPILKNLSSKLDFVVLAPQQGKLAETLDAELRGGFTGMSVFRFRRLDNGKRGDVPAAPAIVFSSGTSGRIKRIVVSERGILYNANVFFSAIEASPEDAFLIFLPLSNFQQKLLIYGCIFFGVGVHLTNAPSVLTLLPRLNPTLFLAPPVFFESVWKIAQVDLSGGGKSATERLRAVFGERMRAMWSGMAPIAPSILKDFQAAGVPLFEAYGMTEYGPITVNLPSSNSVGSVGKPLVENSLTMGADGEVLLRSPAPLTVGYWDEAPEEELSVYRDAGTIATGDIGSLDERGFLWLRGRKKEIIITSAGHKVHPQLVEREFLGVPALRHAILFGNDRPHLGLLVIVESPPSVEMREMIQRKIVELNSGLCQLFPIKKWHISLSEFSAENGLLTRNLKLNRGRIAERYEDLVFAED